MDEPRCPHCRDRGWLTAVGPGGEKLARRCSCAGRMDASERLRLAGVPDRYRDCTLDGFHTSHSDVGQSQVLASALSQSRRYVETFLEVDGGFREGGLLFVGEPGTGKTHLAIAVLRELMDQYGLRGRFVDFGALIESIQGSFDPRTDDNKQSLLRPVQDAEVLVLDELGVRKPTDFVSDVLYAVINERYKQRRATIFTTNFWPRGEEAAIESLDRGRDEPTSLAALTLEQRVPRMLISRLFEMARMVSMAGVEDFRRAVGSHRHVW